jgi:2,4-dienoyl-CoA reductase-like NADH-dependent reductase (Old Yellow Enzyme family)
MIIVEHSYIAASGKASPIQMSVAEDACLPGLRRLAATIRRNGSKAALQLNHAGCSTTQDVIGVQPAGPSAVPHPKSGKLCRELSVTEIIKLIDDFARAARRTREAGFDAVEIHSAHGYLLNQFYSPLTNRRQDEFGGDSRRRIEIHLRVIKAVRQTVGA